MKRLERILVANRGEIACRIIRTIQQEGRFAIAVYSEADEAAPHVAAADAAVAIGESAATASYLNIARVIEAARELRADAIHPGYGFLSENAAFAEACEAADITLIGPSATSMAIMGNKAAAKRRMVSAGVPCVPGYQADDQSDARLIEAAAEIGYPLMVKASAGGGGRGMRLVHAANDLADALRLARTEAMSAFGDDSLILERAIVSPRHVEIQILADQHGHVVHLGERDCSVQRRHQKIIEEAPSPAVDDALRERMGEAAVAAARDIDYVGAGTVEFLLDSNGEFYFLEMNTRLQVEHPVTEMITGLDLVALQISVAEGVPLRFDQSDVSLNGHAMEARLYAEDPNNDFMPAVGDALFWQVSDSARTDAGIETGSTISPFYDPMVAKIIVHGDSRDVARRRLIAALRETTLLGVKNNRDFLIQSLADETFARGEATTAFIESQMQAPAHDSNASVQLERLAGLAWYLSERARCAAALASRNLLGWRSDGALRSRFAVLQDDATHHLDIVSTVSSTLDIDGQQFEIVSEGEQRIVCKCDGQVITFHYVIDDNRILVATGDRTATISLPRLGSTADQSQSAGDVTAPMHGRIIDIAVTTGDVVSQGQTLAVIEAMKMQHDILAGAAGTVTAINCETGQQVDSGSVLIEVGMQDE
ncbi:MAG: biotin carboxylase N-terminal domain-containing protein [Pseudomonadota bacterium]